MSGFYCRLLFAAVLRQKDGKPLNDHHVSTEQQDSTLLYFDTHAHYDDAEFDGDRETLLASFAQAGICRAVEVSASVGSCDTAVRLAGQYPQLLAAVGVHPSECAKMTEETVEHIGQLLGQPKVVAVGEIGLDYHWEEPDRELQKHWFCRQLELAARMDRPVIIHSRDAAQDTMDILSGYHRGPADSRRTPGVIHCYSYSVEQALEYVRMGFYIGIGGVVTFKNARKLREVVAAVPLSSIVLETDSPYLAPVPHRGERNCSLYLPLIAGEIAAVRGISAGEVAHVTRQNAEKLYGLD